MTHQEPVSKVKELKKQLEQTRISHGVAVNNYEEVMGLIKKDYGIETLAAAAKRVKELDKKIRAFNNKRDTLLAKAQSILEKSEMEINHGSTKENHIQGRKTPTTNNTMAANRVRTRRKQTPPNHQRRTR